MSQDILNDILYSSNAKISNSEYNKFVDEFNKAWDEATKDWPKPITAKDIKLINIVLI